MADSHTADSHTADSRATDPGTATSRTLGRYRRWDGVELRGRTLLSTRPLAATRLNDVAAEVVAALDDGTFATPEEVAAAASVDADDAARLLDGLHRRGFLEWAPARAESFEPAVSVVVTVRDDRERLAGCLDALAALDYPEYEVVVVDDGSTDGTRDAAREHALARVGKLRLVEVGTPDEPLGIGASRNRGVEAARGDVVAFTDADCRPRPDWLAALVPCLAAHDVVGGRVRPHGTGPVSVYEGVNSSLDMGTHAARIDPDGATPYLPTANLLARRRVLDEVGFPDRSVAEDVGFCWDALDAGYDVVYAPAGVVEHEYRTDLRSLAARRGDYGASEALLARAHGRGERVPLPPGPLALAVALVLFAGGVVGVLLPAAVGGLVLAAVAAGVATRCRRLRHAVGAGTIIRSRGREALSRAYAVARLTTRYYSGPLALAAAVPLAAGYPRVALAGVVGVAAAVALPAAVEYAVHRPSVAPAAYARCYLADHLGYQRGVYRGALAHGTLAHLWPPRRFRPAGALAAAGSRVAGALAGRLGARQGQATASGAQPDPESDPDDLRTVAVGDVAASFRADTSAEAWWFDDPDLRGERPALADLLARLEPDDALLDVGANVGLYACLAGRALDGGQVVAVEPHPENAARLRSNLERNGVDARVLDCALGATDRPGELAVGERQAGTGTSALATDGAAAGPVPAAVDHLPVDVVTGDALVDRDGVPVPTVVKVDVEGVELAVLRGLDATLSRPGCRLVYCEVHPGAGPADAGTADAMEPGTVASFLRDRGFAVEWIQEWEDRTLLRGERRGDTK